MIFKDIEFEAKISRNYKLNFVQNRERLAVDAAFIKAADARGVSFDDLQKAIFLGPTLYTKLYGHISEHLSNAMSAWKLSQKRNSDNYSSARKLLDHVPISDMMTSKISCFEIKC